MAKRQQIEDVEAGILAATGTAHASRKKRIKTDNVQLINDLEEDEFRTKFIPQHRLEYTCPSACFNIEHKSSRSMSHALFEECFKLIEKTSVHDYRGSTIGWTPQSKRDEMQDTLMHYLLVRSDQAPGGNSAVNTQEETQRAFSGFLSFMITYDSIPEVPVLYVYEIHLEDAYRGNGLGVHLLDLASAIATSCGMSKIMLTCFVSNARARHFYERYGFEKDTISPSDRRTRGRLIQADYLIMSKVLEKDNLEPA